MIFSKKITNNKKILDAYLESIEKIIKDNSLKSEQKKAVINGLIKSLTCGIQSDLNLKLITTGYETFDIHFDNSFPRLSFCPHCYQLLPSKTTFNYKTAVSLAHDPIISPIWRHDRLIKTLAFVGMDVNNPFKYDKANHFDLSYIKYLGIFWNGNGLHSTNSGILKGEGTLFTNGIIDMTEILKCYNFDGMFYIHKNCNQPILKASDFRFGIIFEIGKILLKYKIDFVVPD
ncbi:DUF6710 family protein [Enterococcus faecium]|uniref:DUF6710 family protein n=2 Tax=Enterococcus TaxID=1350 RepID=UPI0011231896|nr:MULTISPECIES: DUF6710 family protein [Bacteria]EGP5538836.1 hypothetical protein [Enterococcus faecium]TNW69123.1 hypothetical protein FIU61_11435 [Enterococcus faecium]